MPAGSGVCRLIGELLSAGRTPGVSGAWNGKDGVDQEEAGTAAAHALQECGHPCVGLSGLPHPGELSVVSTDPAKNSYTLVCVQGPLLRGPSQRKPACALEDEMDNDDHTTSPHKCPVQGEESGERMTEACLLSLKRRGIGWGNQSAPALRYGSAPGAVRLRWGRGSVWFPE